MSRARESTEPIYLSVLDGIATITLVSSSSRREFGNCITRILFLQPDEPAQAWDDVLTVPRAQNVPKKKNALDLTLYKALAMLLESVDQRQDVFCTVITGRGDFFSAGADVKAVRETPQEGDSMQVRSSSSLVETLC